MSTNQNALSAESQTILNGGVVIRPSSKTYCELDIPALRVADGQIDFRQLEKEIALIPWLVLLASATPRNLNLGDCEPIQSLLKQMCEACDALENTPPALLEGGLI